MFSTAERFVPTLFWDPDGITCYNDIAREVRVTEGGFGFVDSYVDVILHNGEVKIKDEELLERLDPEEASRVREIAYGLADRSRAGDSLFDPNIPLWTVPADARDLPPGPMLTLTERRDGPRVPWRAPD